MPDVTATVVRIPTVQPGNRHYIANRRPLLPNPLLKLPIGAIRPEGWLGHQLECMRTGMTGQLRKISKWLDPAASAWRSPTGEGQNGWEELPGFLVAS